jgi:hypothetical protein
VPLRALRRKKAHFHQSCSLLHLLFDSDIPFPKLVCRPRPSPLPPCSSGQLAGSPGSLPLQLSITSPVATPTGCPLTAGWMMPLLRGLPPDLLPLCSSSWPRRYRRLVTRGFATDARLHLLSPPPARSVLPLPPARKPRTLAHATTGLWG